MSGIAQQVLLMGVAPSPVVKTFIGAFSSSSASTWNFTALGIGPADPNRLVVIGVSAVGPALSETITSATIGGVAATIIGQQYATNGSGGQVAAILAAVVPLGTTANVSINFSVAMGGEISAYYLSNLLSPTPIDILLAVQSGGPTYSGAIAVQYQGELIVACEAFSAAATYGASGIGLDANGFSSTNFAYVLGSQDISGGSDPAYAFSISRIGGTGTAWGGPVVAASWR